MVIRSKRGEKAVEDAKINPEDLAYPILDDFIPPIDPDDEFEYYEEDWIMQG